MKNKKVLIPAILTAALAAGGLVGGSLAFFQVEKTHEITISTALVDVTSVIDAASLKTYSLGIEQPAGHFENEGSTATLNAETGKLELVNVAPGDEARFDIKLTNASTIGVRYEVTTILKVGNAEVADADNPFVITGASEGTLAVLETEKTINVGVLFPMGIEDETLMGKSYTLLVRVVAMQSNAPKAVSSQAELEQAIKDGYPVELEDDVQLTSTISVADLLSPNGELVIVGNGNAIIAPAGSGGRAMNINDIAGTTVSLINVELQGGTTGSDTRAVSIGGSPNTTLNLTNCKLGSSYYSVNVASDSENSTINIDGCELVSGYCAAQTWSANTTLNIKNSTLAGVNDKTYNEEGWNNFSSIVVNGPATNSTINIENSKIIAKATTGNQQTLFSFRSENSTVNLKGKVEFEYENTEARVSAVEDFTDLMSFATWDAIDTLSTNVLTIDKDNGYVVTYQHAPVETATATKLNYVFNV